MNEYAEVFKRILNCNDNSSDKINFVISWYKSLRVTEINPFLLLLLKELENKKEALLKNLFLLRDFLIRYRIVKPSGGGGALLNVMFSIINKYNRKEIELSFDDIHYVLSNSNNETERFPDDNEFKKALMSNQRLNHTYGCPVLLAIENYETKNIPVPICEVTIEHLMPQTLTDLWKKDLGNDWENIINNYKNCIGNLAPLSMPWNASNSNRPWLEKKENLIGVQFKITQEVLVNNKWTKHEIEKRNTDIAERAVRAIIGPLPRQSEYDKKSIYNELLSGVYLITDDINVTGIILNGITIDSKYYQIQTWKDLLATVSKHCYLVNKELFANMVKNNTIHRTSKSKGMKLEDGGEITYDPIITSNIGFLTRPYNIGATNYYIETNLSAESSKNYATEILKLFKLADVTTININNPNELVD